jgi:hypothetical protein
MHREWPGGMYRLPTAGRSSEQQKDSPTSTIGRSFGRSARWISEWLTLEGLHIDLRSQSGSWENDSTHPRGCTDRRSGELEGKLGGCTDVPTAGWVFGGWPVGMYGPAVGRFRDWPGGMYRLLTAWEWPGGMYLSLVGGSLFPWQLPTLFDVFVCVFFPFFK